MSRPEPEVFVEEEGDDGLGGAPVGEKIDGFHQPTALHDKGQFLGELADLIDGSPDTRAVVEAEQPPPQGFQLIVVAGPDLGAKRSFKADAIVIGRDDACELTLQDIAVSRQHVQISFSQGTFRIQDLDSNNGTLLNGDSLREVEELVPGDEIAVGETTFRFIELNEAPATQDEIEVASAIEPEESLSKVGMSQINLEVAETPNNANELEKGRALRSVIRVVSAALIAVLLVGGIGFAVVGYLARKESARKAAESKVRFLQAIALVRTERFGDALRVLDRLAEIDPAHPRLSDYRAHAKKELEVYQTIERARREASLGRPRAAFGLLETIPSSSAYADDAEELSRRFERQRAERLVREGRRKLLIKKFKAARQFASQAMKVSRGLESARILLEDIELAEQGQLKRQRIRADQVPRRLEEAVAAFWAGNLAKAQRESESVPDYRNMLDELRAQLRELAVAHRAKAAGPLLKLGPRALEVEKRLSYGKESQVRPRIIRYYADGLYLRGIEQLAKEDTSGAYRWFHQALTRYPNHVQAKARLAELEKRASSIYYQAQVEESADPMKAQSLYRKVTDMTSASNTYHQLAKRRLKSSP